MVKFSKTVPLTVEEVEGDPSTKKVIGEATVEIDGPYFSFDGVVTDEKYIDLVYGPKTALSVSADDVTFTDKGVDHGRQRRKEPGEVRFRVGKNRW